MAGDLEALCELIAARLVAGGLGDDVTISAMGDPDCTAVLALVRPALGEGKPSNVGAAARKCMREVQIVVGLYVMTVCGSEVCHRRMAQLTSGACVAGSVPAALWSQASRDAFGAAGYTVLVQPARGYTYAAYKSVESNAYWAQVPLTVMYCCDEGG